MNLLTTWRTLKSLRDRISDVAVGFDDLTMSAREGANRLDRICVRLIDVQHSINKHRLPSVPSLLAIAVADLDTAVFKIGEGSVSPNHSFDMLDRVHGKLDNAIERLASMIPPQKNSR